MSAVSKLSGARPWMDDKMDKKIQVMKTPDIEAKGLKVVDLSGQSLTALAASVFASKSAKSSFWSLGKGEEIFT